jgi:hypothetical protein
LVRTSSLNGKHSCGGSIRSQAVAILNMENSNMILRAMPLTSTRVQNFMKMMIFWEGVSHPGTPSRLLVSHLWISTRRGCCEIRCSPSILDRYCLIFKSWKRQVGEDLKGRESVTVHHYIHAWCNYGPLPWKRKKDRKKPQGAWRGQMTGFAYFV